MGYSTKFCGTLKFVNEPTVVLLRDLQALLGANLRKLEPGVVHESTYIDLELTPEMDGLQWSGAEKTYSMVDTVNWLIGKMRKKYPMFDLTSMLEAQGEDADDTWQLLMQGGKAIRVNISPTGTEVRCPECGHTFRVTTKKD